MASRRGGDRQRYDAGNVLALARIHPGEFVKLWNFAGDVYRQGGRIEARNALHTRLSCEKGQAEGFFANAIGADNAHSGDDDARNHI